MIKADPNVVRFRRARILYFSGFMLMVVSFALLYLTSTTFSTSFRIWSLIVPSFILLSFFSFIRQERYWERFEQRRIRAAQGDQSLVAEEQPALDEAALALPLTIQRRISSSESILPIIAAIAITMIVGGVIGFVAGFRSIFSPANILSFVLEGLAILVFVLVMLVFMLFLALVFPRTDQRRRFPERGGLLYRPILPIKPATSYEEYNRQMEALPALVVAKSGLQLYDLRDDRQKGG